MSDSTDKERDSPAAEHGQKRSHDSSDVSNVHSSNSWENVQFGDEERKNKFLRLMGAGKKSHHGRFVIGESHSKHTSAQESQKTSELIEKQYCETFKSKLEGGSRHQGIGFVEEKPDEANPDDVTTDATHDNTSSSDGDKDNLNMNEVSSANSWETANLGDDDRKKKFLRLMGAGKKTHQGRFVIGSSNVKHVTAEDSQKVSESIEKQYNETMGQKLSSGFKGRHSGIGYKEPTPPREEPSVSDSSDPGQSTSTEPSLGRGQSSTAGVDDYNKDDRTHHHFDQSSNRGRDYDDHNRSSYSRHRPGHQGSGDHHHHSHGNDQYQSHEYDRYGYDRHRGRESHSEYGQQHCGEYGQQHHREYGQQHPGEQRQQHQGGYGPQRGGYTDYNRQPRYTDGSSSYSNPHSGQNFRGNEGHHSHSQYHYQTHRGQFTHPSHDGQLQRSEFPLTHPQPSEHSDKNRRIQFTKSSDS